MTMTTTTTTIESMTDAALSLVTGGAQSPVAAQVCNRSQFDWMAAHMVPDTGLKPGVQRHVVAHDAQMCGFPMPR
jgi:hypothetical protein